MELIQYHKMRRAVQINASPGKPGDLADVAGRIRQSLMATGLFEDVEVDSTEDVDNLVIAMCTFPPQLTEAQVAARLEQLWEDRLRYPFWEAHTLLVNNDQVELEAASRTGASGHYITVHILAKKARIPTQRQRF